MPWDALRRLSVALAASIACAGVGVVACESSAPSAPAEPAAPSAIDLTDVMQRARSSFHARGDELVGGDAKYEAHVRPDGALTFVPFDRASAAPAVLVTYVEGTSKSARPRVDDDGSVAIGRGAITERLRTTRSGLEQTWELAAAPPGDGPLRVRVDVRGYAWTSQTTSGHHFVDPATKLGFRYGEAVWVDARGKKTPVAITREDGAIAMSIPRAVLASSAYPAALDPIIGPEIAVDVPVPVEATSGTFPVVRPGPGGTFLVAWYDDRPGIGSVVVAVRVDANGTRLDKGIVLPVSVATSFSQRPFDVAFDPVSSRWLVALVTARSSVGVRIDAAGNVLDAAAFPIWTDTVTTNPGYIKGVAAAFDGTQFVVTTSSESAVAGGVYAHQVSAAAKVGPTIKLASAGRAAALACDGNACATLWQNGANVYASRISNAGVLLDASGFQVAASALPVDVAFDGTSYLALVGAGTNLASMRFSPAGTLVDPSPVTIATSPQAWGSNGRVDWNGSRYTFAWYAPNTGELYARRMAPAGTFDDAAPVLLASDPAYQSDPVLAWSGAQHLLVWRDARVALSGFTTLYGTRLSSALAVTDGPSGFPIPRGSNGQSAPRVAFNGSHYLVAWLDNRASSNDIWCARVSATGVPVGSAVQVAFGVQTLGDVASDGTGFLITWRGIAAAVGTIYAARVSGASGAVLDSPPLVLGTRGADYFFRAQRPAATFDGTSYVIAWTDRKYASFSELDIVATRVSPAGTILDPNGIAVTAATAEQQSEPALASDGTNTLIAWTDHRLEFTTSDIFGARLSKAGAVLDPGGSLLAQAGYSQYTPSLRWDGAQYVLVWNDTRRWASSGTGENDVYFTRITAAGKSLALGGTLVSQTAGIPDPAISSMGDGVTDLVAWQAPDATGTYRVRGSFIRASTGEVLDPGGTLLVPETGTAGGPVLAPSGPGKVAMFYTRLTATELAARVVGRFIESGSAVGATCAANGDCRGRYCRDAVCCEEACDAPCVKCGAAGKCEPVVSADDVECEGTCDPAGACKRKNGETCDQASQCATGFCVDGFCCNSACDGACDTCNATPGQCTVVPAGSGGTPSCSPRRCNGVEPACPSRCTTDSECADGFGCDRPTGTCVAGSVCTDEQTLRAPTGVTSDCRPYACRNGTCLATCSNVTDCAFPAACDELGRCISARALEGGGCSFAPARHERVVTWALAAAAIALSAAKTRRRKR